MKKTVISVLKYCILLGVGVALLLLAFKGVDVKKTFSEIRQANLFWLGMSVLVSLFAFVSRAYRWNLLIEPLGYKPSLKNTTAAVMIGYLANLALPRLGEVSRCGSLAGVEDVPFEKLLGTVIVERVIDVLTLVVVIIITVMVQFNLVKNFFEDNLIFPMKDKMYGLLHSLLFLAGLFAGVVILTLAIIYFSRGKSKIMIKMRELFNGIIEGVKSIRNLKNIPAFIFHSIFIWLMYYFMAYFGCLALSATAGLSWQASLLILVAGGIGMSAPVQGGIGTYHLLVSQGLIIYGIVKEHGMAYATLIHGSQVLVVIFFGFIAYIVLTLEGKKVKHARA